MADSLGSPIEASIEAPGASIEAPEAPIEAPMDEEASSMAPESPMVSPESSTEEHESSTESDGLSLSGKITKLKGELSHVTALKIIADVRCMGYEREIKELKEQLDMFRSAAQLGVFVVTPPIGATSQGESMAVAKYEGKPGPSTEYIVSALKSELERCLHSNRMKTAELMEKLQHITNMSSELVNSQSLSERMGNVCEGIENIIAVMHIQSGGMDNMKLELEEIFKENEVFRVALENVQAARTKQEETIAHLIEHIATLHEKFEEERRSAYEISQRTLDERMKNTEERLKYTEELLRHSLDKQNQNPGTSKPEAEDYKFLYAKMCIENSIREAQMKEKVVALVEDKLIKIMHMQQDEIERATEEHQSTEEPIIHGLTESLELEAIQRCNQMVYETKLACLAEQKNCVRSMLGGIQRDVNQLFRDEAGRPCASLDVLQCAADLQMSESAPATPRDKNELD